MIKEKEHEKENFFDINNLYDYIIKHHLVYGICLNKN